MASGPRPRYCCSMSTEQWAALAAAVAGLVLFAHLVLRARGYLELRRMRRRFARGARGQKAARKLLARRGFEVLDEEHEVTGEVEVDGRPQPYTVRVDYLVRQGGRVYGVEVKTGEKAPDPLHRPTRRQLLEYSHLLGLDGLYLLDMERRRLMRVRFPGAARRRGGWLIVLLVGAALGAAAVMLLDGRWPWL